MSNQSGLEVEDELLLRTAQRILHQFQVNDGKGSEDASMAITKSGYKTPDSLEGLRLAVDDMSLAIQHLERLFTARETVFASMMERIERNVASIAGRVDAVSDELALLAARPALDLVHLRDEQHTEQVAILAEFKSAISLNRIALDEANEMRVSTAAELNRLLTGIAEAQNRVG